jgi:hypothetical protein
VESIASDHHRVSDHRPRCRNPLSQRGRQPYSRSNRDVLLQTERREELVIQVHPA